MAALRIRRDGLPETQESPARQIVLTGPSADAINADGQRPAIHLVTSTISVRSTFDHEAPAHSLTVFRVQRE